MTRRLAVATTTAALVVVAGCSDASAGSSAAETPRSATVATSAAPTARSEPASRTSTPGVPEPGSMERPATSSGPLSRRSFPTPRQLGAGWRYAVDPGSAEEGYAGNGTPALARNPQEVVQTAVPLGCARGSAMPTPTHALELDYTLRGATVVAVRGRFTGPAQARTFFAARSANLAACAGRSGSAAIGPLVADLRRPGRDAVASDRTPRSDPWRELAVLDGDTVALLAVQGRDPLPAGQTRRLVRLFRS